MKKIIVYIAGIFAFAGCSMEPILTSSYSEDVAWSSEDNCQMYINKFYPLVGQSYYEPEVFFDSASDILKSNSPNSEISFFSYGSVAVSPENNIFENWTVGHSWVIDCCRFLDGLKTRGEGLPEDFRLQAEAQVRWFRAHVYFEMARRYGASLILYRELPPLGEKDHPRCTPDECWDFIKEDLQFAADNLPDNDIPGKLTKGAAYAMMARAMLYAERYDDAYKACVKVEECGYDLEPDYAQLFKYKRAAGVSCESIVEFGFSYPNLAYSFDKFYCPPGDGGYAELSPTEELVSQYQMADGTDFSWDNPAMAADPYTGREPRFYASILYHGCTWKGRTLDMRNSSKDGVAFGGGTTSTGYYMRKLFDESQTVGFTNSDLTKYYIRFAEIILIKAEALAQLGKYGQSMDELNRIRHRAGFTTDLTAADKNTCMQYIMHERMIELAFEGHRFWDLRRWGLADKRLNNMHLTGVKPVQSGDTITYTLFDADNGKIRKYPTKYNRFPIPVNELLRNGKMEQFEEWK
jgi:hypothetical protein